MNVLVVDDEDSIRQVNVLNMENLYPDADIFEAVSVSSAKKIIEEKSISLIICDYNMPNENGNILFEYITQNTIDGIPFILYSAASPIDIKNFELIEKTSYLNYIQKPLSFDEFGKKIISFMKDDKHPIGQDFNIIKYVKVRTSYFWRFNTTKSDIYISLSPNKFIKIINKNDSYDKSLIDKYMNKDQRYLYLLRDDIENFSHDLITLPFLSYTSNEEEIETNEKIQERIKVTSAILKDLVDSIGITDNTYKSACSFTSDIDKLIGQTTLADLFTNVKKKNDYLYDHSFILACICIDIVKEFEWYNQKSIEKLCFAALFHDITQHDPELAMVHTIEEAQIKGYTIDEIERFRNHPIKAAKLVEGCEDIDLQVPTIIKEHHENPYGTGFPNKLGAEQVGQLTAIFIISHQLVKELYDHQFDPSFLQALIPQIKEYYSKGTYKIVFPAFEKVFLKR